MIFIYVKGRKKLKKLFSVFILNMLFVLMSSAQQAEFYVDPVNGDDTNLGTSIALALKTIDAARQKVGSINGNMTGDIYIYLRGGTHTLSATVEFTSTDSGTNGYYVIYKNYGTEAPVISCGEKITGTWQVDVGSVKKISIGTGKAFRQLYVEDNFKIRARTPNLDSTYTFPTDKQSDGLNIQQGLLDSLSNWQNKVEIAATSAWMHHRLRVSNKYNSGSYTRAVINSVEWDDINNEPLGSRSFLTEHYWVENAYKFLDEAGEWYYDDSSGWLYYWPLQGEDMSTAEVIIPNLEKAFFVNGSDGTNFNIPVSNLKFEGLTIKYSNYTRPNDYGLINTQANTLIPQDAWDITDTQYRYSQQKERITAVLQVHYGKNITVKNCNFENLGGSGLTFNYGGENILIDSNSFKYIAGNGLEVGNDANKPNDSKMIPKDVIIFNNYIEDIAKDYRGGVGILCFFIDQLIIENNEVYNVPYTGISAGWGWADGESPILIRNYTIRYNKVQSYLGFISDGGGIYVTNPIFGTNIIEKNYIKDVVVRERGSIAIYLDGNSRNWTVNQNVVNNAEYWLGGSTFGTQIKGPITVTDNYTTTLTSHATNWGNGSTITGTVLFDPANIPSGANDIINNTGLTSGSPPTIIPAPEPISGVLIIDNGDPGYYENGTTWDDSSLTGYNSSSTRYGSTLAAFAVWNPNLMAGEYTVSIWKVGSTSSDSNAKITVHYSGGVDTQYLDYTSGISGWVELGTYDFEEGFWGYVQNNNSNNGYTRADAVKFEPVSPETEVIDNGDPGYTESGTWQDSGLPGYNSSSTRYGNSTGAYATWTPELVEGCYSVSIYKVVHATSDSNAKIEIVHSGGTDTLYLDYTTGTSGWVELGTYAFNSGTGGCLKNTKNSTGYARADAVRFEFVLPETTVIDNGDPGYIESGIWDNSSLIGYDSSYTRYGYSTGAFATWVPELAGGCYTVSIYKVVHSSSDSNAKIEIVHSGGTDTQYLDHTTGIYGWVELGSYTFDCSVGSVKNTRNSSGYIRADAVKFEPCSTKSTQILTDIQFAKSKDKDVSFRIYPNPVNDYLKITCPLTGKVQIALYNINGTEVYNETRKMFSNETININVSHLISGIYLLRLNSSEKLGHYKVVKKKGAFYIY